MSILNITAVVIVGAALSLIMRRVSDAYAALCSVVCGAIVVAMMLPWVQDCFSFVDVLIRAGNISQKYLQIVLKAVGTAYITQFVAEICTDLGENTLASRIETAEKIYLAALSLPLFADIIAFVEKMTEL